MGGLGEEIAVKAEVLVKTEGLRVREFKSRRIWRFEGPRALRVSEF